MREGLTHATDVPSVDLYYLEDSPDSLSTHLLRTLGQNVNQQTDGQLLRKLRKAWFRGRCHQELITYEKRFRQLSLTDRKIADKLKLTPQAVGSWFNEIKGIESENLELIRRIFTEELNEVELPTLHYLDLAGYRHAISLLARESDGVDIIQTLDVHDFWCLWFLYRSNLWLEANRRKSKPLKEQAAQEISRDVNRVLNLFEKTRPMSRDEFLPVARLEELFNNWGGAYLIVVNYLDTECWTEP